MHEDDAIGRAWDAQHSDDSDALDCADECACGSALTFDDDGECRECVQLRHEDESAEHTIERERERGEAA